MEISRITGCCSMVTISENPWSDITKKQFLIQFNEAAFKNNLKNSKIKAAIMITNGNLIERLRYYLLGFRKIGSYRGFDRRKAHIMIIKFPRGFESFFNKNI